MANNVKFQPDAVLAAIVGKEPKTFAQLLKGIWDYVKAHKLNEKRIIKTDAKLAPFFDGKKEVHMTAVGGAIKAHSKKI